MFKSFLFARTCLNTPPPSARPRRSEIKANRQQTRRHIENSPFFCHPRLPPKYLAKTTGRTKIFNAASPCGSLDFEVGTSRIFAISPRVKNAKKPFGNPKGFCKNSLLGKSYFLLRNATNAKAAAPKIAANVAGSGITAEVESQKPSVPSMYLPSCQ